MTSVEKLKVKDHEVIGVKIDLPQSPPLLLIIGSKGFVMCGLLNIETAEKVGAAAAMVSGVKEFSDVLRAEVKAVTSKAQQLGIRLGMKGEEAIVLIA